MLFRRSKALIQQLQEVTDKMVELTKAVEELKNTSGHNSRINIEKLEIEQAFLDELVFRLESLDIEELSGSLNLGNNFSPKVEQGTEDAEVDKRQSPRKTQGDQLAEPKTVATLTNGSQLKTTDTGYLMSL